MKPPSLVELAVARRAKEQTGKTFGRACPGCGEWVLRGHLGICREYRTVRARQQKAKRRRLDKQTGGAVEPESS